MKMAVGFPEIRSHGRDDVVTDKGNSYEMRLSKMGMGVDFTIESRARPRSRPLTSSGVEAADPGTVPGPGRPRHGPVDLYVLNTPLLRDTDDTQGIASSTTHGQGQSPGDFGGAYLFEATDTSGPLRTSTRSLRADVGHLPVGSPARTDYGIDTTTTLTVRSCRSDATTT
jgi:hypothetical protein